MAWYILEKFLYATILCGQRIKLIRIQTIILFEVLNVKRCQLRTVDHGLRKNNEVESDWSVQLRSGRTELALSQLMGARSQSNEYNGNHQIQINQSQSKQSLQTAMDRPTTVITAPLVHQSMAFFSPQSPPDRLLVFSSISPLSAGSPNAKGKHRLPLTRRPDPPRFTRLLPH